MAQGSGENTLSLQIQADPSIWRSPRRLISGGGIDANRALLARCASKDVPRGTRHAKIVTHMGRDIRGGSVDATASIEPCP
jgi:hypothetical protein